MSERKWILVPLLVMLPACSLLQGVALPGPTAVAATNPAPSSSPQAPVDPADACPSPDAATTLYLSRENGFCMLVPLGIETNPDPSQPEEMIFLQGPRETLGPKQQEGAAVWMQVAQNGPADGLDSAGYAQRWVELYAMPDGSSTPEPGTIGGRPATILKNLPGMIRLQSAFIVADGVKYQITLAPQPGDVPELDAAAIQLWDTVVRSIVFFPRENPAPAVRAQDVCPAAAGETFAYRNDRLGVCSLLPADFAVRPDIPDMFVGGPVIGTDKDFGEVRTSIAFGHSATLPGTAPWTCSRSGWISSTLARL